MKLQVITTIAVFSGLFATTSADAGKFDLVKAVQTAQQINQSINQKSGQPKYVTLPYNPNKGGNPGYVSPHPNPGYSHCKPPVCKPPVCHPPVNHPPVKCYSMKLMNNAGAEVYYILDKAQDYNQLPAEQVEVVKSHSSQPHTISYHNGQEVVEYQLSVNGTYSFEWQGETLMLLEIQG